MICCYTCGLQQKGFKNDASTNLNVCKLLLFWLNESFQALLLLWCASWAVSVPQRFHKSRLKQPNFLWQYSWPDLFCFPRSVDLCQNHARVDLLDIYYFIRAFFPQCTAKGQSATPPQMPIRLLDVQQQRIKSMQHGNVQHLNQVCR